MTNSRAALLIGGGTLLVAWLSFAGSTAVAPSAPPPPRDPNDLISTAQLVVDVRSQGERLRRRLASAPAMQQSSRNPFAFRAPRRAASVHPQTLRPASGGLASPSDVDQEETPLVLIGVAEHRRDENTTRTAVLVTGRDDLIMAGVGDIVQHRYTVTAIGAESVELLDAATGRGRRLTLQVR